MFYGKIAPYGVLALAELASVLYVGHLVFGMEIHGSIPLLFLLSVPYIAGTLGLGLFISTVAKTQAQALQLAQLTLLPSILLSGYIAPRETMPGFLYAFSSCMPATYFIQICRGLVVRGAGFVDLSGSFLALTAISVVLIAGSVGRFRKTV